MENLQELISIENVPAKLDVNFEALKQSLGTELEKYRIVVTAETVGDAKKLATELNATRKVIDDRRKDEVAKASEPVKAFDARMKELVKMCADGRQEILDQVAKFEQETLDQAKQLLIDYRAEKIEEFKVREQFSKIDVSDLLKLTALTPKGNLSGKSKSEIEMRVRERRALQDRTDQRLLNLKVLSYEAGLEAPLTEDHVKPFLMADDEAYDAEIKRIIAAELERQKTAEQRLRERIDKENEQKRQSEPEQKPLIEEEQQSEPASQAEAEAPAQTDTEDTDHEETLPPADDDGKANWVVTCDFEIKVTAGVNAAAIEAELRKVMAKAGITTLRTVVAKPAA